VRFSRRNVTALAGTFLASTAIRAKAQAQSGSPNQNESSRFRIGVNLHLDRFSPSAAFFQLAHLKAAGVQSVRGLDAALAHVLPGPGKWQFAKSDRDLKFMETLGITPYGSLGYGVAWASSRDSNRLQNPGSWSKFPPDDLALWAEYVTRTVSRYRERVKCWSPWNEPDSFGFFIPLQGAGGERNPADVTARRASYLELQKATYRAAKAADSNVTVLSGGFAMGGDYDRGFLPWLITNGLMDYCDVLEIHTYWSVKNLEDVLGHAQELMRKVGANRPIWVTEFGIALKDANDPPSIGMVEHQHVANMAPKALATALALGVERFYWYQGYTEASAPVPLDHSEYSLSVTDGPTPAFWSFSTAARLLRNASYIGPARFQIQRGMAKGYTFSSNEGQLVILWAVSPDTLDNKPAAAQGILDWGGQRISMQLSERPIILVA
jgi:hypothetical protein